jgi:(p)ppGpp synthase/HD superfamily hydrolase
MQSKLADMLLLATKAHDGQFDKAGKPYILHCLTVMHFVQKHYDDEDLLCIALGHDLLEDTDVDYQYLVFNFNKRIADGILALTKSTDYDAYKEQVKSNKDAVIVKMADLRHNSDISRLKGVTEKDIARTAKYLRFYEELKQCL